MRSRWVLDVEIDHVSGKFADGGELDDKIGEAIDEVESSIDVCGIGPDGDSEYEVVSFEAEAVDLCDATRKGEPGRCVLAPHHDGDHVDRAGVARWTNRGRRAYAG